MSISSFVQRTSVAAAALLLLFVPAVAQQKPAIIVSISSVDETMSDIQYVAQATGNTQATMGVGMAGLAADQYLRLLDKTAPIGITAVVNGPIPDVLAFVPVKDFEGLKAKISETLGPPADQGDGVWKLNGPQPSFMKQSGKFVFIAQDPARLNDLPQNPAAMLEGLDKRYNIGVRLYVQRIPMEMRQELLGLVQNLQNANQLDDDDPQAAFQKAMAASSAKNMELMVNQAEIFEMGIAIDQDKKEINLEYAVTATEGSELADELAYIQDAETRFGSVLDPGAALNMNISMKIGQTQMTMANDLLKVFRTSIEKEMKGDGNFPSDEARAAAEKVVGDLLDVAEATIKGGKLDSVGSVSLDGSNLQFSAAAQIAEGEKLNQTIRDIVALAKEEPDFPEVQLDAAKVGDVTIHLLQVPVPADEEDARAVFGDQVEIAVGVGPDATYLCVGAGAVDCVKKIAAGSNPKTVRPMAMRASIGQLIKFGAQFNDDPAMQQLLGVVDKMGDRDHVEVLVEAIPNGARYKFRLEDGLLKAVGFGIEQAMGGGGF